MFLAERKSCVLVTGRQRRLAWSAKLACQLANATFDGHCCAGRYAIARSPVLSWPLGHGKSIIAHTFALHICFMMVAPTSATLNGHKIDRFASIQANQRRQWPFPSRIKLLVLSATGCLASWRAISRSPATRRATGRRRAPSRASLSASLSPVATSTATNRAAAMQIMQLIKSSQPLC